MLLGELTIPIDGPFILNKGWLIQLLPIPVTAFRPLTSMAVRRTVHEITGSCPRKVRLF